MRFGYRMSTFDNDVDTLYFDNPWRITDATDGSSNTFMLGETTLNVYNGTTAAWGYRGWVHTGIDPLAGINEDEIEALKCERGVTLDTELGADELRELVARLLNRAQTEGRADDTEDVIRRRLEVYTEQTEPLIDVYRQRGLLIEVDGLGEVNEVTERIFSALAAVEES